MDEILDKQFGELSTGAGQLPRSAAAALRAQGHEVARSTRIGRDLPGTHGLAILGPSGAAAAGSGTSICIAGELDDPQGFATDYLACQYWDRVAEEGLYFQGVSTDGFHLVLYVPGFRQEATAELHGGDTADIELLTGDGIILVRGSAPSSTTPPGTLVVSRDKGSTLEFPLPDLTSVPVIDGG
jgi:hypothetical protein